MFNHSNVYIASAVDNVLRKFVVTPDMHRVHHSIDESEHNCNFGFNFPWWDVLFKTYRAQPSAGHEGMQIGLGGFRDIKHTKLIWLLLHPFIGLDSNSTQKNSNDDYITK